MFCINKFNRVVEVPDDFGLEEITKGNLRKATTKDIETWNLERERRAFENRPDSILFQTVAQRSDGYGMSRHHIQQEVFRLGKNLSEQFQYQKIGLLYGYPQHIIGLKTPIRIIFTMFESDKIPSEWVDYLEIADQVIVPSKFCYDAFKKAGIESMIIPLGYNDRLFTYHERQIPVENNQDFVFIHYDSLTIRKGFFEIFQAFNEEFEKNERVKLILKTTQEQSPVPILKSQYPNIEVITQDIPEQELFDILKRAHCMVFPSRAEGFGITPLEAMATGIPAIIPNAHGISEYFNENYMIPVKWKYKKAQYHKFRGRDMGNMIECDVKDLRKKMRYAFNHQEEMKELGKKASEYVKKYTYQQTAKSLVEVIKKFEQIEVKKRKDKIFLSVEEI